MAAKDDDGSSARSRVVPSGVAASVSYYIMKVAEHVAGSPPGSVATSTRSPETAQDFVLPIREHEPASSSIASILRRSGTSTINETLAM